MSGSIPRLHRGRRLASRAETADFGKLWPADFITEGQDQTRGWFYSQLGASTIAFGKAPYKSVCMHGFALDAEGKKMSKSLGNVVTPEEVIAKVGVDVLRLYVLSSSAPWDDLKFNWDGVATVNRATNILWNVYRFPIPYMILDQFEPQSQDGVWNGAFVAAHLRQIPDEDRWIISRINTVAGIVDAATKECQLHRATRELVTFILEDLSRWYVQLGQAPDVAGRRIAGETVCLRDDLLRDAPAHRASGPLLPAHHRGDLRQHPVQERSRKRAHARLAGLR